MNKFLPCVLTALPRWTMGTGLVLLLFLQLSCGHGDITGPGDGLASIVVSVHTVGVEIDPDGYAIRIDGGEPRPVSVDGTVTLTNVAEGLRTLTLEGVAVTCDPEGGPERRITVPRFSTMHSRWSVACTAKPIVFSNSSRGASRARLFRMNLDGTGVKQVGTVGGQAPRWSPDGTQILFDDGTLLYTMAPDGSRVRAITRGAGGTWSPDGQRIAFTRHGELGETWAAIHSIAADGSDLRLLTQQNFAYDPDWGPDGRIAHVEWLQTGPEGFASRTWLSIMDPDGKGVTRLYEELNGSINRPAWSPDGSRIAFATVTPGESSIFTIGVDGGTPRRRTGPLDQEREPRWFADSRTLLFTRYEGAGELTSELRMGAHDAQTSFSVSHFPTDDHGGDIRPGTPPPN